MYAMKILYIPSSLALVKSALGSKLVCMFLMALFAVCTVMADVKDDVPKEDKEATHDFCHPNDYGMLHMGHAYARRIREVLDAEHRARCPLPQPKEK